MELFDDFDIGLEDLALAGALAEELADERREWERLKQKMEKEFDENNDGIDCDYRMSEDYDPSP